MAQTLWCPHQSLSHVREILPAEVFQLPAFEQVPDAFLRIQVRSIAGKPLQMEPLSPASWKTTPF